MIIARLSGGLGNQMFQYAAARRLAARHGTILKLETSRLLHPAPGDTPRAYSLDCFSIAAEPASATESAYCRKLAKRHTSSLFRVLRVLGLYGFKEELYYVPQQGTAFDHSILDLPDNICLDGFWQSEKYFLDIRESLQQEFALRHPLKIEDCRLAEHIQACNSVSLHVRRGDYLTNPNAARHHGTCGMDYYERAVRFIREAVPKPQLFIFSDDPAWCEAHLRFDLPMTVVSESGISGSGRDLALMNMCRHHVIANSSFSWWGAWLGRDPKKLVAAPARWFTDPARDSSDIIPEGWVRF